MSTISRTMADAFDLLRAELYRHLDHAGFLADSWGAWTDEEAALARLLIGDLVHVVREVLREHRPQDTGDCVICARAWPCPTVETIHTAVTEPDRALAGLGR